jgi:PAS domain S-box-containing protein
MGIQSIKKERLYTIEDLENLLDSLPYEIWMKDNEGKHVYVNKLACEKIGLHKEQIIGKTDYEFRPFDMAEKCYETDKAIIDKKIGIYSEERIQTDNFDIWYEVYKFHLEGMNNNGSLLAGIAKEVSINRNMNIEFQKMILDSHKMNSGFENYIGYLKKLVDNLKEVLKCESINIFKYDKKSNLFNLYLRSSIEENIFLEEISLKFDYNIIDKLSKNNLDNNFKELLSKEFKKYYRGHFKEKENSKFIILPVTFANELIGIMHIYFENDQSQYDNSFFVDIYGSISNIISIIEFSSEIREVFDEYETKNNILNMEKESLEKLINLEKTRGDFFTTASHEFKTPINIILATVKLLLNNLEGEENNKFDKFKIINYLKTLNQNTYRILRLVNNVLENTQINNGFYKLDIRNYNIISIVEDIVMSTVEYIGSNKKNIIFDTDQEEVFIGCDAEKIEKIILNLISNSLKFTDENGEIEVEMKTDFTENKVFVYLRNNGPSISKEEAKVIFNKFVQGDELLTRRSEGCGIGLFLAKSFVEMHGGEIWVNTDVKEGVEFAFYLPIKIADEKEILLNNEEINNNRIEKCRIEFSDIYSI